MLSYEGWKPMKPTPIDELRKPHPEQKRVDTESAALLRATALDVFRRIASAALEVHAPTATARVLR